MENNVNIISLLEAGISAESARQKAVAGNIANLNTPGYRRSDIRFEEVLSKVIESNQNVNPSELKPEFYQPMNTPVDANGNDVSLDTEVGQMVKNSLMHKTYAMLLRKKYQQYNEAIQIK